jgi:hypothetical protein
LGQDEKVGEEESIKVCLGKMHSNCQPKGEFNNRLKVHKFVEGIKRLPSTIEERSIDVYVTTFVIWI